MTVDDRRKQGLKKLKITFIKRKNTTLVITSTEWTADRLWIGGI